MKRHIFVSGFLKDSTKHSKGVSWILDIRVCRDVSEVLSFKRFTGKRLDKKSIASWSDTIRGIDAVSSVTKRQNKNCQVMQEPHLHVFESRDGSNISWHWEQTGLEK